MLAAAVAASSQSIVQVLQLSPETIDLAIRVGIEAERRAKLIEDNEGSWTLVVTGLSEDAAETIVNDFNTSNVRSPALCPPPPLTRDNKVLNSIFPEYLAIESRIHQCRDVDIVHDQWTAIHHRTLPLVGSLTGSQPPVPRYTP